MDESGFQKLRIWQDAMALVTVVYRQMKLMPQDELYGLSSQIRRSSVSIPANIAEGSSRGKKEFVHFLKIALGSLYELETQLQITVNLEMLNQKEINEVVDNQIMPLKRQINALIGRLKDT